MGLHPYIPMRVLLDPAMHDIIEQFAQFEGHLAGLAANGIGPAFNWKAAAISPPEQLVI